MYIVTFPKLNTGNCLTDYIHENEIIIAQFILRPTSHLLEYVGIHGSVSCQYVALPCYSVCS